MPPISDPRTRTRPLTHGRHKSGDRPPVPPLGADPLAAPAPRRQPCCTRPSGRHAYPHARCAATAPGRFPTPPCSPACLPSRERAPVPSPPIRWRLCCESSHASFRAGSESHTPRHGARPAGLNTSFHELFPWGHGFRPSRRGRSPAILPTTVAPREFRSKLLCFDRAAIGGADLPLLAPWNGSDGKGNT